ncbi:hypothetical protein N7513_010159 [Penicillium frequentans]|nr:hypothetical protein N7513_010159 [Penicillium glabrum]
MNNTTTHDEPLQRELYFFYGTLMDRSSAQITGWICKLWDEYPVLLAGPTDQIVHGMACEIQRLTDRDRLFRYETSVYRIQACCIELRNGRPVIGKTFVWNGDLEALREDSFELREWVMNRMELL